ncbi:MAG: NADH-quinone oxidoreductase subunit N, partial [Phycisphaerae bacterium]
MTYPLAQFWTPPLDQLWRVSPELALVGTIVAVLIVSLFAGRNPYTTAAITLLGVLAALLLAGAVGADVFSRPHAGLAPAAAPPMLIADNFAVFFKLFLLLFLVLVTGLWVIGEEVRRRAAWSLECGFSRGAGGLGETVPHRLSPPNAPEFFTLLLGSALGMILMVSTLNLLMIILAIELASLPSYAIAGFNRRDRRSAEASLKYVVFGAVTAAIMLYGVSLLYGYYGTLDVPTIAARIADRAGEPAAGRGVLGVGLFALCVGIGFKIAAVPFHFWCPDVFEGAPIEVTTWLSVASKAAGLGLFLRLVSALTAPVAPDQIEAIWGPMAVAIGIFASLTCTIGNFAAYRQDNVKRLLAYSSIAHAGYMLMAGAILLPAETGSSGAGTNPVMSALAVYVFTYLFMNLGAFGATAIVSWQTGSESLSAFADLGRRTPWVAVPMAVCLFSLVGLPPLGGFVAKWWLLYALGDAAARQPWLWGLVIILVLNTLFSLYYYVRVIVAMFLRGGARSAGQPRSSAPLGGVIMVNACAVLLLVLGTIGVRPVKTLADHYASDLFRASVP